MTCTPALARLLPAAHYRLTFVVRALYVLISRSCSGSISFSNTQSRMARAYQEAHILDSLKDSVKALQNQTSALTAAKGSLEQKVTNVSNANEALKKKNEELETRVKAKYTSFCCPPSVPSHTHVFHSLPDL